MKTKYAFCKCTLFILLIDLTYFFCFFFFSFSKGNLSYAREPQSLFPRAFSTKSRISSGLWVLCSLANSGMLQQMSLEDVLLFI